MYKGAAIYKRYIHICVSESWSTEISQSYEHTTTLARCIAKQIRGLACAYMIVDLNAEAIYMATVYKLLKIRFNMILFTL